MIRHDQFTTTQWLHICRRVYAALLSDDRETAVQILEEIGFNSAYLFRP